MRGAFQKFCQSNRETNFTIKLRILFLIFKNVKKSIDDKSELYAGWSNIYLTLEVPGRLFLTHESSSRALPPFIIIAGPNAPVTFNHLWACTIHQNFIPLAHLKVWKIYLFTWYSKGYAKSGTSSVNVLAILNIQFDVQYIENTYTRSIKTSIKSINLSPTPKSMTVKKSHILDFINKKNYIRKISNGRIIHVLRQRLDTVGEFLKIRSSHRVAFYTE